METIKIPDASDWADFNPSVCLSNQECYDYFFSKSDEEMQKNYELNVVLSGNGFRYMPIIPFQYYIIGFRDYVFNCVKSESWNNPDAASVYLRIILCNLEERPHFVIPIFEQLKDSIEFVAENQALYEADEDIYGSFIELKDKVFQLAGQA